MRPAPSGEVPRSVSALSNGWLTGALCSSIPAAEVVGCRISGTRTATAAVDLDALDAP
jgi:hypothetical protein